MKLTRELIHEAATGYCGWNWVQLRLLGVGYPQASGWLENLIGVEVDDRTWELVMKLRGVRKKAARAELCLEYGVTVGELAQTPMKGPRKLGADRLRSLLLDFDAA